ncbi:hypothetical protein D3C72_1402630 [compost metagenome]
MSSTSSINRPDRHPLRPRRSVNRSSISSSENRRVLSATIRWAAAKNSGSTMPSNAPSDLTQASGAFTTLSFFSLKETRL